MFEYLLAAVFSLFVLYFCIKYYVENGYYFPVSRRHGVRRYVFPKNEASIAKINRECRHVCSQITEGVLQYPFLEENATSAAFSKRVITIVYERNDPKEMPVAFHAALVFAWKQQRGFHGGLMMVVPAQQNHGLLRLATISGVLHFFFRGIDIITDISGYANGAAYLTIQDRSQQDCYPVWRQPETPPKQWHLEVTRFMMEHYRSEFGCSRIATLDEQTLVVRNSNAKEGGGTWQLVSDFRHGKTKKPQSSETAVYARQAEEKQVL